MSDQYLEAAAQAYAEGTPTDTDREIVTEVIEAWVGDRELYEIDYSRDASEGAWVTAHTESLERLGVLVRVSVTEGEPT